MKSENELDINTSKKAWKSKTINMLLASIVKRQLQKLNYSIIISC